VAAYTAQFGNGFSAGISAEARRTTQIIGQGDFAHGAEVAGFPGLFTSVAPNAGSLSGGAVASTGFAGQGYAGWKTPDVVANLRVDQAWGSAQIGGALHEVNAAYYVNPVAQPAPTAVAISGIVPENTGNPNNEWGWAAMAGLRLNAPFIGQGDYLAVQGIYTQGALRYIFQNPNSNWWIQDGNNTSYAVLSDGVYGGTSPTLNGTGIELTTAWGVNAGYEHFWWNPRWRTSLYGGYTKVEYNNQANAILCTLQGDGGGVGIFAVANPGCDNNWQSWWVGSRTQWNVTKDFYMGLDVAYLKMQSMSTSDGLIAGSAINPATTVNNVKTLSDQDNWMVRFRVHRDFYP
jgi:hypothetical protein